MLPKDYELLRNELIDLLKQSVALPSVNGETRDILSQICRKTLENQFEIVLAGEFQGGKSTTFNAICDGRDLSPRGSGIKTSGCIVSAQNLSDPGEPEKAVAEWRSSAELIAGFSDLLLPHLQNFVPARFYGISAPELIRVLNLESAEDRRLTAQAAEQEWQIWKKNKAAYDPEQKGHLDILRFATLAAHYYADNTLIRLRHQREFNVEDIGKMIVFPQDWEERWLDMSAARFKLEEILFIFIRNIRLRLHSENLSRLGCVITDCPGLFASRWDTEVARRAMFNADAILYLLDGAKTVKLSDLRALQFIRQNGMEYKLFYGCNIRGHSLSESRRIAQSSMTLLKNNGFLIDDDEFILFHALLALLSIRQAHQSSILKSVRKQLAILDLEEDIDARQASGLDTLTEMVEKTVIRKKARSILIDNGSQMAANCLLEAEGTLKSRENLAVKKEKEFRVQVDMTERELKKFRYDCTQIIERLDEESPDYKLAEDIWSRLEDRKEALRNKAADRIYNDILKFREIPTFLFNQKKLKEKIITIIREEMNDSFQEAIHSWLAEIKDGNNKIYNAQIANRVKSVGRDLRDIWKHSALTDTNLLSGITIPEFSGNLELDNEIIFREMEKTRIFDQVHHNAIFTAGGLTGLFTASSGILVAIFLMISRMVWMVVASVAVILINIIIIFMTRGMMESALKKEIRENLFPAFTTLFLEIRDDVKKEFREFSRNIRELYKAGFLAVIDKPQQIFEQRKLQAEHDFKKSQSEREAIAQEAKHIREDQIQPLRIRLQNFVSCVEGKL